MKNTRSRLMLVSAQPFKLVPLRRWLLVGLAYGLVACSSPTTITSNSPHTVVAEKDHFLSATGVRIPFSGELEAWGASEDWLLWMLDDDPRLHLASLDPLEPKTFAFPSPVDSEAICLAMAGPNGVADLFLGDGDGTLHHYWLWFTEGPNLREVRKLWTNADVEHCHVIGDSVVIENGPLGETAYAISEERDPILSAGAQSKLTQHFAVPTLIPAVETQPVSSAGDAADDSVILPAGENTWIVGTNKQWGLIAYNLKGKAVDGIARGRLNNVDALRTSTGFLLAASNRSEKSIDLFRAQPSKGEFIFQGAIPIQVNDPYGLCMGERNGAFAIFVGGTNGDVQYWQVSLQGTNPNLIETLHFDSQTEGCVYDAQTDVLYVGEEATGVWRVALDDNERSLFAEVDGQQLVADIEGLDMCLVNGERALLGSSQGDDSFLVWPLDQPEKSIKFRVSADPINGLDGASETDGIACSNQALPGFPRGLLVLQDGRNRAPEQNQNFKYVDWRVLEALVREPR